MAEEIRPIVIWGETPSKKNNRVFVPGRRGILSIPSKRYAAWHTQALWQLKGVKPITVYPCALTIVLWASTRRKFDIDNRATSILDVLQDAGILENDDWAHVQTLTVQYAAYEKGNGRAEIWVDE